MLRSICVLSALVAFTLAHAKEQCSDKTPHPIRLSARYTTPAQSGTYVPYTFNGSSGTFNLTPDTLQTNNIGTITSSGTLGSCNGP